MKTITISGGAGCGKTQLALRRYREYTSSGLHVILSDETDLRNNKPDLPPNPDVHIKTNETTGALKESTVYQPS